MPNVERYREHVVRLLSFIRNPPGLSVTEFGVSRLRGAVKNSPHFFVPSAYPVTEIIWPQLRGAVRRIAEIVRNLFHCMLI